VGRRIRAVPTGKELAWPVVGRTLNKRPSAELFVIRLDAAPPPIKVDSAIDWQPEVRTRVLEKAHAEARPPLTPHNENGSNLA